MADETILDTASERALRKQLERERLFLKRLTTLKLSEVFVRDSKARIARLERRLDE